MGYYYMIGDKPDSLVICEKLAVMPPGAPRDKFAANVERMRDEWQEHLKKFPEK